MIRTEGLTKKFGSTVAVDNLNMEVHPGEFFSFLGPNGAGKTTTIKLVTGLLIPTEGRAFIDGKDVQLDPVGAKQVVGYIPDRSFLYEKLTGREFLEFVGGLYEMDGRRLERKADELMELFGVLDVADLLIEEYSHGMKQKLSFSAAFLHDPKVIIVDEPWVGLDPKSIRFLKNYLKEKVRDGLSVFMSTHTLSIAEEVSDRVGIINGGHLIAEGTVDEIMALKKSRNFED
ncbi:MAG: ABC transporter ATP-binding protein, partial [Candidatus Hydrogenedentes bacterium]|nr:ABC transporter ATP-binding protein [Candidatus Hydrogenedentota bacterium]